MSQAVGQRGGGSGGCAGGAREPGGSGRASLVQLAGQLEGLGLVEPLRRPGAPLVLLVEVRQPALAPRVVAPRRLPAGAGPGCSSPSHGTWTHGGILVGRKTSKSTARGVARGGGEGLRHHPVPAAGASGYCQMLVRLCARVAPRGGPQTPARAARRRGA
jgi:hypothetical protein